MTTSITAAEGVLLCHAVVAHAAEQVGVPALVVKGHVAIAQGLRDARQPVDVDVLVPADRAVDLGRELERRGWSSATSETTIAAFGLHSHTYRHPFWPCEIDVHHRFPGFHADPAVVFEMLWSSRTRVSVAGRDVQAPDVSSHAALLLLHGLRDEREAYHGRQLARLVERLQEGVAGWSQDRFLEVAERGGAGEPLRPVLALLGLPAVVSHGVDPVLSEGWDLRTHSGRAKIVPWLVALRAVRGRERWRLLRHALWLPEQEIRVNEPGLGPGRRALLGARLRRFGRVLRFGPHAVRLLVSARKGSR